jgi:hypothetical protein
MYQRKWNAGPQIHYKKIAVPLIHYLHGHESDISIRRGRLSPRAASPSR